MVDAVVTWVDGSDPAHVAKRLSAKSAESRAIAKEAIEDNRFRDNDEIRYCLRSIFNNAPWIKRVFLVTDNQWPASIDKIKAKEHNIMQVSHEEIFKSHHGFLPTFNARTIESCIYLIEDVDESFVYLNHDMFFTS